MFKFFEKQKPTETWRTVESQESDPQLREEKINNLARILYEKRISTEASRVDFEYEGVNLSHQEIEKVLKDANFDPADSGQDEAKGAYMYNWDREQAEEIYEARQKRIEARENDLKTTRDEYTKVYADFEKKKIMPKGFGEQWRLKDALAHAYKNLKLGDLALSQKTSPPRHFLNRKQKFIDELKVRGFDDVFAEELYRVELHKLEYDDRKVNYGQELRRVKESELKESPGISQAEIDQELKRYETWNIYHKVFSKERTLLQDQQIEGWPPEERGRFKRMLDWYLKTPRALRLAGSAILVTGAVALGGGFAATGAAGALGYGAWRIIRGAGGMAGGILAGKIVDKLHGVFGTEAEEIDKPREIFTLDLDRLREMEREQNAVIEKIAKEQRAWKIGKAVAMFAVGYGAAMGLGMAGQAWVGVEGKVPEIEGKKEMPVTKGGGMAPPETAKAPTIPEAEFAQQPTDQQLLEKWGKISDKEYGRLRADFSKSMDEMVKFAEESQVKLSQISEQTKEKLMELGTVKRGEGYWQPVRRQLLFRLESDPEHYGLKPEELGNKQLVNNVLNRETMNILEKNKIIGPDMEYRIRASGTKLVLDGDDIKLFDKKGELIPSDKYGKYLYEHKTKVVDRGVAAEMMPQQPTGAGTIEQIPYSAPQAVPPLYEQIAAQDPARTSQLLEHYLGGDYSNMNAKEVVGRFLNPIYSDVEVTTPTWQEIETGEFRKNLIKALIQHYGQPKGTMRAWLIDRAKPEHILLIRQFVEGLKQ